MKKTDIQCPDCAAAYQRIELVSRRGQPGAYRCKVCNHVLETFDGATEIVYRLTVVPEKTFA
jgi:transposase-like protein